MLYLRALFPTLKKDAFYSIIMVIVPIRKPPTVKQNGSQEKMPSPVIYHFPHGHPRKPHATPVAVNCIKVKPTLEKVPETLVLPIVKMGHFAEIQHQKMTVIRIVSTKLTVKSSTVVLLYAVNINPRKVFKVMLAR